MFVAPEMKHGDIELVVSGFFAESWWVGQSEKKKAQESSRVTTDQPRISLKANWQTDFVDPTKITNFRENSSSPYQWNLLTRSLWKLSPNRVLLYRPPWSETVISVGWQGFISAICQQDHPWRVPKQDDSVLAAVWCTRLLFVWLVNAVQWDRCTTCS